MMPMDREMSFFAVCPLQYRDLHNPEKRDEIKQASIDRWEIGFIPFFRANVKAK